MRSLWLLEALAADGEADAAPVRGAARADVCVVGGGYVGLWTALRIKELDPSADVAVVEADVCGGGASGRNGGFVLTWWPKFASLAKLGGVDEARRLCRASSDGVEAIGAFCADNGIDARFHMDGYLWAATNQSQMDDWRPMIAGLARYGEYPFEEWTPDEVGTRSGSAVHLGGAFERTAAIVQPALLARGMREVALRRGIRVYERSPMTSLEPVAGSGAGGMVVRTAEGEVRADRVVLAMNAWGVRFTEIRRRVLVIGSDVVATATAPERLAKIGWTDGMAVADSRYLVHYYRTTDDGRIVFGKGGGRLALGSRVGGRFEGAAPYAAEAEKGLRRTYPAVDDVPITHRWTGPIDRTRSGLPFFGHLDGAQNVAYGVGFSGNGVGPSYVAGRILASMALGRDDEWSSCCLAGYEPARWPPEPVRFVGGSLVKAALLRIERAQDQGRSPSPVATGIVRLAPTGIVPMRVRT
ncbi:MAG TPA: FAD-dependent oxidoreductase [Candidatus Sulfotelmatobacter sp.]|nr:FAD-dependent oxidoreductase [Candidatus Sulfotelmatobacter sp.]